MYRLINGTTGQEVWRREQSKNEDSPDEILVSDEGWSILRTHGFSPQVIAVDPSGTDVARVLVLGPKDQADHPDGARSVAAGTFVWHAIHLAFTTAGMFWSGNSWRYFLALEGRPLFVWRASWGQRLMIDLAGGELITEGGQSEPALMKAVVAEESRGARTLLASLASRMAEVRKRLGPRASSKTSPLLEAIGQVRAAIHLAGVHGLRDCVPYLREWERVQSLGYSTSCTALGERAWLEAQRYRGLVQHSLRKLDEEPAGHAVYHFGFHEGKRLKVPECLPDRGSRAAQLHTDLTALEVLALLGAPDHIGRESFPDGEQYRWVETWAYDHRVSGRWQTLTLMWEQVEARVRLVQIEQALTTRQALARREEEILRY